MASTAARDLLNTLSCTFDREDDVIEETQRFSKTFEKSTCKETLDRIERTSWADADTISRSTVQCLAGAANGDYQEEKGTPLQESSRQIRNASERLQSALKSARELRENELQQKEEQKGRELEEREKQLWRDLWNIEKKKQEAREENEEVSEL